MSKPDDILTKSYRPFQISIFAATWLSYVGYYFCRKAFYVVKADMGDSLSLSVMHLAWLGEAYLAAYMVGQFSSAYFGRKLGPKLLLLVGMGISIVSNLAFGIANGFPLLMVFMLLNGLAQGTGWPGCIGSLAYWFKRDQRGTILGVWSTCYQIGPAIATGFAAWILGAWGWRYSYFGASSVLLLIWGVVLILHPDRPEKSGLRPLEDDEDHDDADGREAEGSGTGGGGSHGRGRGLGWTPDVVKGILVMGMIYFCIKFLRYTLWSWAPFMLQKGFGLTGSNAGYLSTVFELSGAVGVIAAGYASDRLFKGKRAAVALGMLGLMSLGFIVLFLFGSGSILVFTVCMGFVGFMLFGPDSLLSGVGAIDVGSKRGALAAAGIINGMGSIGPLFQEPVVGYFLQKAGHDPLPVFLLLMCISILGVAFATLLYIRARRGLLRL